MIGIKNGKIQFQESKGDMFQKSLTTRNQCHLYFKQFKFVWHCQI